MLAEEKHIASGERGGGQKGDALLAEEKHITRGEEGGKVTHCWKKKNITVVERGRVTPNSKHWFTTSFNLSVPKPFGGR